ncbi:MAG TPA: class A beta-lactamase-related serine hydrolase [Candidatus Omnitrophota bacterium]|nr:class A beta-lactamase-related serine hydrolase [Candidatus Omnitrophota bacterium]HPT06596.1 class A beta-lactamase-related serine hydrolase [Candidatus Omnitrophota bacterium]
MKKGIYIVCVCAALVTAAGFGGQYVYNEKVRIERQRLELARRKVAWEALTNVLMREINGSRQEVAVVIKDLDWNREFVLNENEPFPAASLVKVPIMAAVFQAVQDGKVDLNEKIVLKGSVKTLGSGILKSKPSGTEYTVEELIQTMITYSDNTAANMLIDRLGFDYLNAYFKKLGLEETNLSRKMMDFRFRRKGVENFTTARDMSIVLERFYRLERMSPQARQCLIFLAQQKINDRIPRRLPEGVTVAHKTGLERNVCHDVGIVYTEKGNFLICVLTRHASTSRQSKDLISRLALHTYNYYQRL